MTIGDLASAVREFGKRRVNNPLGIVMSRASWDEVGQSLKGALYPSETTENRFHGLPVHLWDDMSGLQRLDMLSAIKRGEVLRVGNDMPTLRSDQCDHRALFGTVVHAVERGESSTP